MAINTPEPYLKLDRLVVGLSALILLIVGWLFTLMVSQQQVNRRSVEKLLSDCAVLKIQHQDLKAKVKELDSIVVNLHRKSRG
jgi:glucose uptake protein GlcU